MFAILYALVDASAERRQFWGRRTMPIVSAFSHDKIQETSQRSLRGLDWFAFFVADIQTGWGPFVATYLTSVAWTQLDIGLILTIGTITGLALQIPAGALVDRIPAKRFLAAVVVASISASALLLALWPIFSVVVAAKVLHAIASSLLGPTLVAISLGLVGYASFSLRLGRNVRFLSFGNAIAAGVAGGIAYYFSNQAIFFLMAALGVPTLIALAQISSSEIDPELARGGIPKSGVDTWFNAISGLAHNRVLLSFAATIMLFQLANAAMLPILAGILTKRAPETAALVLAICILVPQFVVVAIAPWIGVKAQSWGRRPLLLLTFFALSARAAIFAVTSDPYLLIGAQLFDGISAASLGVLVPLIIADVTRGSGRFNFAQGMIGAAVGIGASFSTTLAGFIADTSGAAIAFLLLACVGVTGLVFVFALVPETRGAPSLDDP
jgi:MFS family permease